MGPDEIVDLHDFPDLHVFFISRRPEGSGRAVRHAYPGRSSIEPTTILLGK
jgi:hypothetical protein